MVTIRKITVIITIVGKEIIAEVNVVVKKGFKDAVDEILLVYIQFTVFLSYITIFDAPS